MTIVVLLVLAVIWGAVLIPPALRARAEGRPGHSIGSFRRQLGVLQRTGPATVPPAHRLLSGPAAAYAARSVAMAPQVRPLSIGRPPSPQTLARKRRRDVFQVLLAAMGGSLVLGLLPPLRALLVLHVVLDVAFVAYVALLVRMRNVAAEREMKVRFLPSAVPGHLAGADPVLALRRSAN